MFVQWFKYLISLLVFMQLYRSCNVTEHNDTQLNWQHKLHKHQMSLMLSVVMLSVPILLAAILSVIRLRIIILSVVMMSVLAPYRWLTLCLYWNLQIFSEKTNQRHCIERLQASNYFLVCDLFQKHCLCCFVKFFTFP